MLLPDDPLYLTVISALMPGAKDGLPQWEPPWAMCLDDEHSHGGLPRRADGSVFRGASLTRLRAAAKQANHRFPTWLTEAELLSKGGELNDGAAGVTVRVAYGADGSAIDAGVRLAGPVDGRRFHDQLVYNVSEITGLPEQYYRASWVLMPRNKESRIPRLEAFFRDLQFDRVHRIHPTDGARARLEFGTARVHMPPWLLFNSARDYYVTLAHEAVHWVRYVRGEFDESVHDDLLLYDREDLIAEVGAALLCADLSISNAPLSEHVLYIESKRHTLGDPAVAILGVAEEAAQSVAWLHQKAPGHRLDGDASRRRAARVAANDAGQVVAVTRDARQFVADAQALREPSSVRDAAWIAGAVRVLSFADRLDLDIDDVRAAIEAEAFLAGGGIVKAADYVEWAKHGLRHDVEQAWRTLCRQASGLAPSPSRRL